MDTNIGVYEKWEMWWFYLYRLIVKILLLKCMVVYLNRGNKKSFLDIGTPCKKCVHFQGKISTIVLYCPSFDVQWRVWRHYVCCTIAPVWRSNFLIVWGNIAFNPMLQSTTKYCVSLKIAINYTPLCLLTTIRIFTSLFYFLFILLLML